MKATPRICKQGMAKVPCLPTALVYHGSIVSLPMTHPLHVWGTEGLNGEGEVQHDVNNSEPAFIETSTEIFGRVCVETVGVHAARPHLTRDQQQLRCPFL